MDTGYTEVIHGYVRENYHGSMSTDILSVICKFYSMARLDSKILSISQQIAVLEVLFDQIRSHKQNENALIFRTELLFRASRYNLSSQMFHKKCSNQGATISIVQTNYNHIFAVAVNKSFVSYGERQDDPHAFLLSISPRFKLHSFHYRKKGQGAINEMYGLSNMGPIWGNAPDIWIADKNLESGSTFNSGSTFLFQPHELTGAGRAGDSMVSFRVCDYETFRVIIK